MGYYCEANNEKEEFDVEVTLEVDEAVRRSIYGYTLIAIGDAMSILYD